MKKLANPSLGGELFWFVMGGYFAVCVSDNRSEVVTLSGVRVTIWGVIVTLGGLRVTK